MAQDFWQASGYRELESSPEGVRPRPGWFAMFLQREELLPPADAGPCERALHARLLHDPMQAVADADVAKVEDTDAAENWREFLRFRDRIQAYGTLENAYRDLYRRPSVDLAPPFVDAMVHAIVRAMLEGVVDPWPLRAAELFFRRQRVSAEGGRILAADATTIEVYADTGGFGSVGRLLRSQATPTAAVKMDVLNAENAPFYFLRDGLYSFVLDLTPGGEGVHALAQVLERWVARMTGVRVAITPVERIEDERWRWHAGLDVDATAILNSLYRQEAVAPSDLERIVSLFRLEFLQDEGVLAQARGRPVHLGLACRPDRTLRMKPQNLLVNLPLESGPAAEA